MKKALIDYIKRGPNDEIYTPDYAVLPLLKYLPKNKIVWECSDFGRSNITKVLKQNGYKVISTHKKNFNFLTDTPDFDFDIIITNPPYSLKNEFIQKCYDLKKPFALLLPITALEGVERGGYLSNMESALLFWIKGLIFYKVKVVGSIRAGFCII